MRRSSEEVWWRSADTTWSSRLAQPGPCWSGHTRRPPGARSSGSWKPAADSGWVGRGRRAAGEVASALLRLVEDPAAARDMGRRAQAAIAGGEGALARHLALIEAHLGPEATPRVATA